MISGFSVQAVSMEGFKGFTSRQEVDVEGRHLFLLGQNGNGKSSIIEAIRWGLFGSTGRPNEVVDNRSHSGACRVILSLTRDKKRWNLQRTLIRGISGGSDATLTDEAGQEHRIREIMPQLDSVDAGEGTYIIFSSQATPLRRQPQDLTPFERTVINHLGLTHPRSLLSEFDEFLVNQCLTEQRLGERLNEVRDEINNQISAIENQRGIITSSPPWEGNQQPSRIQSEKKVKDLIAEIGGNLSDESLSGVSLDGLISHAEDTLKNRRLQGDLEDEVKQVADAKGLLEGLRSVRNDIITKRDTIEDVQSEIDGILDGASLDELRSRLTEMKEDTEAIALRHRVVEDATKLVGSGNTESVLCPVCESEHQRPDLEATLEHVASQLAGDYASVLTDLEDQFSDAGRLGSAATTHKKELAELEQRATTLRTCIDAINDGKFLPQGQDSSDHLDEAIKRCMEREESLKSQVEGHEDWFKSIQARLSNLKRESNFHTLQGRLEQALESRNRFGEVNRAYGDLVSFGESVRTIRQAVEVCLNGRLEEGIPGVSENLSQVFYALTRHPWFDRLDIDKNKIPKLELRVASSQDPSGLSHPTDVLNGQAESALELVPYFAFSQTEDAPTEVHLVLLDDPTRAFDEEHIGILVERLANLGRHVQLVVASQETARFRELLPQCFKTDEYVIIEPTEWSYYDGPKLNIEYG